ncbi:TIGR00180 family glycosyltransferase [Azospirillum halopraeferens]|uniref:TIGR00180 family glycosyltransferase n=1 Tax=Azospirillum halopraeferens TaxID=34010 RepID=UPI00048A460E|nr:TIGR00180 family glycosyltransferase [Azospirillum halopraeferens]
MQSLFTLVVPTYNRSHLLSALLRMLSAQGADFPVMVLDSGREEHRAHTRALLPAVDLRVDYREYDSATAPFDKFRDGFLHVTTPYCALCADDDLVMVDGVRACVDVLERAPDHVAAHGYYFSFLDQGHRGVDLLNVPYYGPGIAGDGALGRIGELLHNYQAITYAVYRTSALQRIFSRLAAVRSVMFAELLSGVMTAAMGKVARVPCVYNGRSARPSEHYENWHPLEWLIRDPAGLAVAYAGYRDILLSELAERPDLEPVADGGARALDLMHVFFLMRNAAFDVRRDSHGFIIRQVLSGRSPAEFWSDDAIQGPLHDQHYAELNRDDDTVGAAAGSWPRAITTPQRVYTVHEAFDRTLGRLVGAEGVAAVAARMDAYRPAFADIDLIMAAHHGDRQRIEEIFAAAVVPAGIVNEALEQAVYKGHTAIVRFLAGQGADVRAQDSRLLFAAVNADHWDAAVALVEFGADPHARDGALLRTLEGRPDNPLRQHLARAGLPALRRAAAAGDRDAVLRLIADGIDLAQAGPDALRDALTHGHGRIAAYLYASILAAGAERDDRDCLQRVLDCPMHDGPAIACAASIARAHGHDAAATLLARAAAG